MAVDFVGCYIIEHGTKMLFADLKPKTLIVKGKERREARQRKLANHLSGLVEQVKANDEKKAQ